MATVAWLTANLAGSRRDVFFFFFSVVGGRAGERARVKWSNWRKSFILCQRTSGSQTHFFIVMFFFLATAAAAAADQVLFIKPSLKKATKTHTRTARDM